MKFGRVILTLAPALVLLASGTRLASRGSTVPIAQLQMCDENVGVALDASAARYYRPAVGGYRPAVGYYRPAVGYYRPATGYYRPYR